MKKMFFSLLLMAGMGVCANAQQSSFEITEEHGNYFVEQIADNCNFVVTDAQSSISGTTVTIRVYVEAAFTPAENGTYTVVVKPEGKLRNILDSQQKSLNFSYTKSNGWFHRKQYVEFYCSVDDNSYNQCNSNSFSVSTCYKN